MEGNSAPTPEDFAKLQQTAEQALKVAEEARDEGKGKREQQAAAAAAIKEESEAQGLGTMSEDQANMIAAATIAQMEERGAFGAPAEEVPPTPADGGAPPPASATPPPASPAPSSPPSTGGSGTPPEQEAFEAPRKKSLAERFQGK